MLCIFSIVRIWSRVKVKCDGKQFRNITWKKHGKMQNQEGGLAITRLWQMEVLGNFGTYS
jgi:hypothetical protein